jgi:hypothetical protein
MSLKKREGLITGNILYYLAAITTAIAGILHLVLAYNGIGRGVSPITIFFIVAGLAQLFWVLPIIRRWGIIWYYIGIAGTIILIIMWAITRLPGNPITGRGGPLNEMGVAIEVFQIAFVVLTTIIIIKEKKQGLQLSKNKRIGK